LFPATLDVLIRHAAAGVAVTRSLAGAASAHGASLVVRHPLTGSIQLQLSALALLAASLLLPFMPVAALRCLAHPSRPAPLGAATLLTSLADAPSLADDSVTTDATATPDASIELGWLPVGTPLPHAESLRLTRRSIERGPPFFL
jgi:hypothetical protein